MSKFLKEIKDQIIIEYPEMEGADVKLKIQGREFDNIDDLTLYVAHQMWNTFDETLFQVDVKKYSKEQIISRRC